jgi:hypothetical protein
MAEQTADPAVTGRGSMPPAVVNVAREVGPGGVLEFTRAGGTVQVPPGPPPPFEVSVSGAIYAACVYNQPTLFRAPDFEMSRREAVLISRWRYEALVRAEGDHADPAP